MAKLTAISRTTSRYKAMREAASVKEVRGVWFRGGIDASQGSAAIVSSAATSRRGDRRVHVKWSINGRTRPPPPPQTNGVIERYHGAIKIEQLWRQLPADGAEMTTMVEDFRQLYNTIRPHEALAGARPIERYLADPNQPDTDGLTAPLPTRQTMRIP